MFKTFTLSKLDLQSFQAKEKDGTRYGRTTDN
jgi:hypothetical protein